MPINPAIASAAAILTLTFGMDRTREVIRNLTQHAMGNPTALVGGLTLFAWLQANPDFGSTIISLPDGTTTLLLLLAATYTAQLEGTIGGLRMSNDVETP